MASSNCLTSSAKRNRNWTDDETSVLIELWEQNEADLRRTKRNRLIHEKISKELEFCGYKREVSEVQMKIRNLTRTFRQEKMSQGQTGGSPSTWRFFLAVQKILGCLPSNQTDHVRDSLVIRKRLLDDLESANDDVLLEIDVPVSQMLPMQPEEHSDGPSNSSQISDVPEMGTSTQPQDSLSPSAQASVTTTFSRYKEQQTKKKKKTRDAMLESMLKELKESNQQMKNTDEQVLKLLNTQNELCREQNALLRDLINKK